LECKPTETDRPGWWRKGHVSPGSLPSGVAACAVVAQWRLVAAGALGGVVLVLSGLREDFDAL
jgi:hypothetical protein